MAGECKNKPKESSKGGGGKCLEMLIERALLSKAELLIMCDVGRLKNDVREEGGEG